MGFNHNDFKLNDDYLYEVIVTTFSENSQKKQIIPNTSAMGIKFIEDNMLNINPYPNTNTYKNLKENGYIGINFVDNVYLYALAALKEKDSTIGLTEFPVEYLEYFIVPNTSSYKEKSKEKRENITIPYIKDAWLILFGNVIEESQITKSNEFGDIILPNFKIIITLCLKLKESFKFFNRAENLALETIILATKLKIAREKHNKRLFNIIQEKINNYMNDIQRYGKNVNATKTINLVNNYISNLKD
jgi:hypothetical protein